MKQYLLWLCNDSNAWQWFDNISDDDDKRWHDDCDNYGNVTGKSNDNDDVNGNGNDDGKGNDNDNDNYSGNGNVYE